MSNDNTIQRGLTVRQLLEDLQHTVDDGGGDLPVVIHTPDLQSYTLPIGSAWITEQPEASVSAGLKAGVDFVEIYTEERRPR